MHVKLKLKMFIDNLQLSLVQLLQCNDFVERGAGCKLLRLQIAGAVFIRGRVVQDREASQRGAGCFRGAFSLPKIYLQICDAERSWQSAAVLLKGQDPPFIHPGELYSP